MDKAAKEKFIEALGDMMNDFVREQFGEETLEDLREMGKCAGAIHECLHGDPPRAIPLDVVDRYNQLFRKHFTVKPEE